VNIFDYLEKFAICVVMLLIYDPSTGTDQLKYHLDSIRVRSNGHPARFDPEAITNRRLRRPIGVL
jgi:hypothetical protein